MAITKAQLGSRVKVGESIQADEAGSLLSSGYLKAGGNPGEYEFTKGYEKPEDVIAPPATPRPIAAAVPSFNETLAKTKEEQVQQTQSLIQAIRDSFAGRISEARQLGLSGEARTKALNVKSGLAGSTFASTAATEAEKETGRLVEAKRKEEQVAIETALGQANENAIKIAQLEQQSLEQGAETSRAERERILTDSRTNAALGFKALASQGKTYKDLPEAQKESLRQSTGYSDLALQGLFAGSVPETQYLSKDWVKAGTKMINFIKDPTSATGFKKIELDTGVDLETDDVKPVNVDGEFWLFNKTSRKMEKIGGEKNEKEALQEEKLRAETAKIRAETLQVGQPSATEKKETAKAEALKTAAVSRAKEVKTLIDELKSSSWAKSSVLGLRGPGALLGRPGVNNFINKVSRLKALLSIEAIKDFRGLGSLSDREFGTASAAASAITIDTEKGKITGSEKAFDDELERIRLASDSILTGQDKLIESVSKDIEKLSPEQKKELQDEGLLP